MRLTNCLADWSFGLGIGGLFFAILCLPFFSVSSWPPHEDMQWNGLRTLSPFGLPAIISGVIAIAKIRRGQSRMGMRKAIAGIILGMLTIVIASATVLNYNYNINWHKRRMEHNINLHFLALAAEAYSDENGGRFPPSNRWREALQQYAGYTESCSSGQRKFVIDAIDELSLAMNQQLSGVKRKDIKNPDETVLFFDSAPDKNPNGGPELLAERTKFGNAMVVFVDGGVQGAKAAPLKWKP